MLAVTVAGFYNSKTNKRMDWEIPVLYVVIIGLEVLISNFRHQRLYTWRETVTTVMLSILNGLLDLGIRGGYLLVMSFIFGFRLFEFEQTVWYWLILFLLIDFQFYWLHRLEHFCRLFWAAHVTHHSAEHMNFSVGFRASLMRPLYDFIFFLPIAFMGFAPLDILLMYSICQIWSVFLHTELVGKLGWLEWVFMTPSHHRVHHGSNARYLDRNMGMVLIVWDRWFGTFQPELSASEYEPIRYGLTKPLDDQGLVNVVTREWINIWDDLHKPGTTWKQKFRYVFGKPGWSHQRGA